MKRLFLITLPPLRFPGHLPSHHLSLTSSNPLHLNLGTHGMTTPTKSSVVLVAGSALKDLKKIMEKLNSLAENMKMIPYAVILLIRETDIVPDTARHAMSPPVVSFTTLGLGNNLSTGSGPCWQAWLHQLNIWVHLPRWGRDNTEIQCGQVIPATHGEGDG